jgi:nitroimidazol reductase NimA-like FMN-containing flavoprotein (pyridoxamine 5'-phosphate oxidase superfamily)
VRLKKALANLIEWERVCRIATTAKSGMPHLVPVCHVVAGGKIYFASENSARKVAHLRSNPRIAVTVDLYSDAWANLKGVMVQGTAKLIGKGPRFKKIRSLLYRKYPQYPDQAAIGESDSVIIEVTAVHVFSWGVD